jgi:hypothetical protein
MFQGYDLADMFKGQVTLIYRQTSLDKALCSSVRYLGVVPVPSVTLTGKFGGGRLQIWRHLLLLLSGYGTVLFAMIGPDWVEGPSEWRRHHSKFWLIGLWTASAACAVLSFLVHALVPPDMSIAYFLWVRSCVEHV